MRVLANHNDNGKENVIKQIKDLMSRTIALHMCYKSWYISLPSSAKQQREMNKFWVFEQGWPQRLNFLTFF